MRLAIPELLLAFITVCAAFPKLGDVFEVDTRDPSVHLSSCLRRAKADDPESAIFDPDTAAEDDSHMLNKLWKQTHELNSHALDLMAPTKYDSDKETKKLMTAFFGIIENAVPGKGKEPARDKDGNVRKDKKGKSITLAEWEKSNGRSIDRYWYFYMSFGGEHGYMVLDKKQVQPISAEEHIPFPLDPQTKTPSYCMLKSVAGWTWDQESLPKGFEGWTGTDSWLRKRHVALCPHAFADHDRELDVNLSQQSIGKRLDDMRILAVAMYHEMFHMVYSDMEDESVIFPKRQPDGKPHPEFVHPQGQLFDQSADISSWPDQKTGFRTSGMNTCGGIQCMTLPMYTLASKETKDLKHMGELRNPESYAWFSLTLYLTNFATGALVASKENPHMCQTPADSRGCVADEIGQPVLRGGKACCLDRWLFPFQETRKQPAPFEKFRKLRFPLEVSKLIPTASRGGSRPLKSCEEPEKAQ
ncbi:hypothetical protein PRZ48_000917 [Zasmidium cellare]|uniref:Metalloprotease n=1 Tax=Zasmidium cellare TaxID=395010 RepID=A0ABR0F149_ZASCE|nr:hypothetical protein PRZ48_000917 [Zasmidium cellare]